MAVLNFIAVFSEAVEKYSVKYCFSFHLSHADNMYLCTEGVYYTYRDADLYNRFIIVRHS